MFVSPAAPPVSAADLRHLWAPSPYRRSNYRFVRAGPGRDPFAQVTVNGVAVWLGSAPTERGAAALAVAWLRDRYGPDWPERHRAAVAAAKRRPVRGANVADPAV